MAPVSYTHLDVYKRQTNATARGQSDGIAKITIVFEIHDLNELRKVVSQIKQIRGIITVSRVFGRRR